MGKAISSVVLFTLIGKILGFIRELMLSFFFGTTGVSDAYLISQTIPGTIFQFVGTGLTTCFIPIYYKILRKEGRNAGNAFTNQIITIVLLFSTVVITLVWAITPVFVKIFAAGFQGQTLAYAIVFTRIGICSLYFSTLIYVYNSFLQANSIFGPTAFAAIPNSLVIIVSIILGSLWNLWALSVGSTFAPVAQLIVLWPVVHKLGFRLRLNFYWKDSYLKLFFKMMVPVILGVSINEINTLIDRSVASQVSVGGISALTYANSLIMLIQGGFAQPVATVFYPNISKEVEKKNVTKAKELLQDATEVLFIGLIPITIGFIMYAQPITKVLFGRGAFDEQAIGMTSTAVAFYAIGIVFVGLRELLSRYYYSYADTKTPMKNAMIGMAVNIILNLTLSRIIGIGGLALATSVSALITTSIMWVECRTKTAGGKLHLNVHEFLKIVVASIVMGGGSFIVYQGLDSPDLIRLIVSVAVGGVIYLLLLLALRVEMAIRIVKSIQRYWRLLRKPL